MRRDREVEKRSRIRKDINELAFYRLVTGYILLSCCIGRNRLDFWDQAAKQALIRWPLQDVLLTNVVPPNIPL